VGGGGAINAIFEKMAQAQQQQQLQPAQQSQESAWGSASSQLQLTGSQMASSQQTQSQIQPQQRTGVPSNNQPAPPPGSGNFYNMFFGSDGKGAPPGAASKGKPGQPQQPLQPQRVPTNTAAKQGQQTQLVNKTEKRLDQVPATIKAVNTPTDKETFETELIQSLLVSYFDIVRKNVKDTVPKSIIHFLVNSSRDNLQNELVSHLYKDELFDELLEESPAIAQRRSACKTMLDILRRAHDFTSRGAA